MSFHDDKLWQEAYTAVIDLCALTDENEVIEQAQKLGLKTLTIIADGVSRRDRRERDMKLRDAAGRVAGVRSLLSVAWAQDAVNDETFAKLDGAYEALANKLPR
ncbi:MAG: four helix bundle protein [Candidatus Gottesmanbacteria bacterium]|nr:four helix bundle protein [Candidatus Gottesmanbacteria bacterium]